MDTNVTLNDMILMVNIIDVCSERGSFKGAELAPVGTLREKLAVFVKANQPTTEETKEESAI